jgi:hypothetical protein
MATLHRKDLIDRLSLNDVDGYSPIALGVFAQGRCDKRLQLRALTFAGVSIVENQRRCGHENRVIDVHHHERSVSTCGNVYGALQRPPRMLGKIDRAQDRTKHTTLSGSAANLLGYHGRQQRIHRVELESIAFSQRPPDLTPQGGRCATH